MSFDPKTIPLFKKQDLLKSLTEDQFRDILVRPLFLRKGLKHGAELCGPEEAGKDCYFVQKDPFGTDIIYAVQTKVGNLNLGRKPAQNLVEATTQLKTALSTEVIDSKNRKKQIPNFAFLCISGILNEQAKQHILNQIGNPNIRFLDVNDLVPEIDEHYPEFWNGIIGDTHPYLKKLIEKVTDESSSLFFGGAVTRLNVASPVTDEGFAPLKISRTFLTGKKVRGQILQDVDFEELTIEQLIGYEHRHILILGEAGCGKSTALRRLVERTARGILERNEKFSTPVFLRAVEISQSTASLAEDIISATRALTISGDPAFGIDRLQAGEVTLLIDALDEIGNREHLNAFAAKLTAFRSNYGLCQIVIAGRNYTYLQSLEALADFRKFTVDPIGHREAQKIIKNLGKKKGLERERTKEVLRQLEHIHGIDLSPLLVTVFVISSDVSRRDIPANMTELFAKYTEELLGRWDSHKAIGQQYESNVKGLLLQRVAFKMHSKKLVSIDQADFRGYIESELADVGFKEAKIDALLDEILRSGLLREFDGKIEFRHLLIQEYFAGRGISDPSLLTVLVSDEWWRRAIVFYFGANPANEASLRQLVGVTAKGTAAERFNVAITIGLAAQACYFIKVKPKAEIFTWVLTSLGGTGELYMPATDAGDCYPIHTFVIHYLMGRDGVAADCLEDSEYFLSEISKESDSKKRETMLYWYIVGLIEAGKIELAATCLKKVPLGHSVHYLAIHLGAFLVKNVRAADKTDKAWAKKIMDDVAPRIGDLRRQLLREFKSQLIELRRGEIKELPEGEIIELSD